MNKLKKYTLMLIFLMSGFFLYGQADTTRHITEAGYRYEKFSNGSERSFYSMQYGHRFKNKYDTYNDLFVKSTYQNRGESEAFQHSVDYYPKHKKGYYFFSARYSNSILFPTVMVFAERFTSFGERSEWSLGTRYLRALEYYDIYSLTGTYGIYYGNFYTYVRPIVSLLEDGYAWNGQIVTRYYDGNGKNYLEGSFLYGEDAGSVRPTTSIENSFGLDTYLVRVKGNLMLPRNWWLAIGVDQSTINIPKANGDINQLKIIGFDIMIKKKF